MRSVYPRILIAYNTSWYVWILRMPLIRALQAHGCEVTVLAPRDEYTNRIVGAGIDFREISLQARGKNPFLELRTARDFLRAYRELRPDVVLHYTIKPNLYGSFAARILRIPAVNNITGLGAAFDRAGALRAAVRLLYRAAFARVERVFFQNPDDRDTFVRDRLVRKDQAGLLPGSGVDLERYTPGPGVAAAPFIFLYIGRLLKAKGVEDLIRAARVVKHGHPDARVVLLGKRDDNEDGAADPRLLDEAAAENVIELAGTTDDVRPFIAASDCVVLPSFYREGTPRSLLEAAAMGKPLIAADSVGTREPVRDGVNGFLCRPRDPADLAAKMQAMLELSAEARARMGAASRRIAEERFDEQIVTKKYMEIIDRLVGKAR